MRELSPDLADKVYTSRYPCTQFTWKTAGDSLLGRDNLDLLPIIRRILVQCLTEALPKAVRISHNTVTSVTPRPSKDAKAVVNFADGTSEVADLVVGADGIRSPVRHCLFPGEPDKAGAKYLGVCAVGGVLDVPLSKSYTDNPSILFSIGAAGVLGYCGLSKTEANKLLYFSFQKSEQMPDRTKVDYQLITKQLRERHNDRSDPVIHDCITKASIDNTYLFAMCLPTRHVRNRLETTTLEYYLRPLQPAWGSHTTSHSPTTLWEIRTLMITSILTCLRMATTSPQ